MNDKGIQKSIRRRIEKLPDGAVFTAKDFSDIADADSTRHVLKKMTDGGEIVRVARGLYNKPSYSKILEKNVPASVDDAVRAIARARNWKVAPAGAAALNMLGLDTQVPAKFIYVSDGPYTDLEIHSIPVKIKHVANKDMAGMSDTTLLVIQALKELGQKWLNDDTIEKIASRLNEQQTMDLVKETAATTSWIRDAIRSISERKGNA